MQIMAWMWRKGNSCTVDGMGKLVWQLGEIGSVVLIIKTELSYDPAILLLDIYPKEIK